ncbi:MAG: hypothetical protein WC966_09920 [Bradymonadales bacterium]
MRKSWVLSSLAALLAIGLVACDDGDGGVKKECETGTAPACSEDAKSRITCVENKIVVTACAEGLVCNNGQCVVKPECTDGVAARCKAGSEKIVEYCSGGFWLEQSCVDGKICDSGICKEDPNKKECYDTFSPVCVVNSVKSCGPDGKFVEEPCGDEKNCERGACVPKNPCSVEGEKKCVAKELQECKEGSWSTVQTCEKFCSAEKGCVDRPSAGDPCTNNSPTICEGNEILICEDDVYEVETCDTQCSVVTDEEGSFILCTEPCTVEGEQKLSEDSCVYHPDYGNLLQITICERADDGNLVTVDYYSYQICEDNYKLSCNVDKVFRESCKSCTDKTSLVCEPFNAGDTCPENFAKSCKDNKTLVNCDTANNTIEEITCAEPTPVCKFGACVKKPVIGDACGANDPVACDGKNVIVCRNGKYTAAHECLEQCSVTTDGAFCTTPCDDEGERHLTSQECDGTRVQFSICQPDEDGVLAAWPYIGPETCVEDDNNKYSCPGGKFTTEPCGTCTNGTSTTPLVCTPPYNVGETCPENFSPLCKDGTTAFVCNTSVSPNVIAELECDAATQICKNGDCADKPSLPEVGDTCNPSTAPEYCDGDTRGLYCHSSTKKYVEFTSCTAQNPCRTVDLGNGIPYADCTYPSECTDADENSTIFYRNSCEIGEGTVFAIYCLRAYDGNVTGFPADYTSVCLNTTTMLSCKDATEAGLMQTTCSACVDNNNGTATCTP